MKKVTFFIASCSIVLASCSTKIETTDLNKNQPKEEKVEVSKKETTTDNLNEDFLKGKWGVVKIDFPEGTPEDQQKMFLDMVKQMPMTFEGNGNGQQVTPDMKGGTTNVDFKYTLKENIVEMDNGKDKQIFEQIGKQLVASDERTKMVLFFEKQ